MKTKEQIEKLVYVDILRHTKSDDINIDFFKERYAKYCNEAEIDNIFRYFFEQKVLIKKIMGGVLTYHKNMRNKQLDFKYKLEKKWFLFVNSKNRELLKQIYDVIRKFDVLFTSDDVKNHARNLNIFYIEKQLELMYEYKLLNKGQIGQTYYELHKVGRLRYYFEKELKVKYIIWDGLKFKETK